MLRMKPRFGHKPFGARDARLLLIAYFDPNGIETIPEGIAAWQALSRHEVELLNLWPGRAGRLNLPEELELRNYEGLIIHSTISYFPQTVQKLDLGLAFGIASFDGVKMLMKQDEQVHSGELAPLIRDKAFDIVCTCLAEAEQEKVYPRTVIGQHCTLLRTLTGYVSPMMRQGPRKVVKNLGLTYRGSIQPLEFGRLGYEKRGVGYDMVRILQERDDIQFDISSRWEDRVSGAAWEEFLQRSNVVLGVESGSNIFDFDGSVVAWCRDYAKRHGSQDPSTYEFYRRAHEEFLHTVEGNVNYAQISPRHFEAAAAGAAQLLYEGDYSDLFHANRHFFPLKRDLSNVDAVIDFLKDDAAHKLMAECAFEEIIGNKDNWYESFVARLDNAVDAKLVEKGLRSAHSAQTQRSIRPSAYILCAHDPKIDPRVDWFADTLQKTHDVTIIGTYHFNQVGEGITTSFDENGVRIVRVERTKHGMNLISNAGALRDDSPIQARFLLAMLADYATLPNELLKLKLGGQVAHNTELRRFRDICEYMVNTNSALLEAVEHFGPPNLIIGVDLEALFAAAICKETYSLPAIFDAHEYWPFSYTDFQHWEIEFWGTMEGRLSNLMDINISVTPQLCKIMAHEYSTPFRSLPNAASKSDGAFEGLEEDFRRREKQDPLKVLFQGGFAEGRGLEEVVRAWAYVKSGAQLILRGPENSYRDRVIALARSLGLSEDIVSFPPPVSEEQLIPAARMADIGLIPYNPSWFGYRYCCPNKLSQYSAAGLPILTSATEFVAEMVQRNDMGFVVDIENAQAVAEMVDWMSDHRDLLIEKGRRARDVFEKEFNWEALGRDLFRDITDLTANAKVLNFCSERIRDTHDKQLKVPRYSFKHTGANLKSDSKLNVLTCETGAQIISSSPFFEYPNDAAALLRTSGDRYAAALPSKKSRAWIEFSLATPAAVDAAELEWLDSEHRATTYRIMIRASKNAPWTIVVDEVDATVTNARLVFPRMSARFVRLEASDFTGQPRMLIRRFELFAADDQTEPVVAQDEEIGRSQLQIAGYDLLNFESGASVVSSSPFTEFPNDPGYLLRNPMQDGYAAGLPGGSGEQWIEFALSRPAVVNALSIEWYSDEIYATAYKVLVRTNHSEEWVTIVHEPAAKKYDVTHSFERITCKFIRLETYAYCGQQRLLARKFDLLAVGGEY